MIQILLLACLLSPGAFAEPRHATRSAVSASPTVLLASVALDEADVRKKFLAAAEKNDAAACTELLRSNPSAVLGTLDADLEGSLKLRESAAGKEPDMAAILKLHERALWGARLACEGGAHPMLLEYVSSFVGWNAEQQKQFRGGQKAFGRAMKSLQAKDAKAALVAADECLKLAGPLADWWGIQMGWYARACAQRELGDKGAALESLAYARTIAHDLGLLEEEYGLVRTSVDLCAELDLTRRGLEAARTAIELAGRFSDTSALSQLFTTRAAFEEKLGLVEDAVRSRRDAEKFK